jgi:hypothetical protein
MSAALTELSHTLWRQRRLLETLVYRLEVQQLVLSSGRNRWLEHATRDVESVAAQVQEAELERALRVSRVNSELHLSGEPSLRQIAESAPGPWGDIMTEHLEALRALSAEAQHAGRTAGDLLVRGFQATQEFLNAAIGGAPTDGYAARGRRRNLRPPVSTIDRTV